VLGDRALNVNSSLVQVGPKWIEGKPKTASGERRVDLGERTVGLLLMVQLAQDEDRKRWGAAYRDNGRVFAREDGSDLSPEAVTKTFRRLATSTGLPTMRLHDLRHVAASLILAGVPVHVVADRLGHADAAITLRVYAHVLHDDAARVADVFVQALGLRNGSA
jgi:integrase